MQPDQRAARRRFIRVFLAATLPYVGLVFLADYLVESNPDAGWRYAAALLPAAPGAVWVVALVRYHRGLDELEQRIQLEALALAFAGTAFLAFVYGFLQMAGLPHLNWGLVGGVMGALWLLSDLLVRRRRL